MHTGHKRFLPFVVYEAGQAETAIELIKRMGHLLAVKPFIISPYYLPKTAEYKRAAQAIGTHYLHFCDEYGASADIEGQLVQLVGGAKRQGYFYPVTKRRSSWFTWLRRKLNPLSFIVDEVTLLRALRQYRKMVGELRRRHRWFYEYNFAGVFMFEDNVERDSFAWIEAANRYQLKSFVYSFGQVSDNEFAETYVDSLFHRVLGKRSAVLRYIFWKWAIKYKGRAYFRLPLPQLLAFEFLNLSPQNPLIVNTGNYSLLLLESEYQKREYRRYRGTDHIKFEIVGSPVFDDLYQEHHQVEKLASQQKTLLVAVPPNQYPGRPSKYFTSYEQLLKFWITSARSFQGFEQIIFSLHPSLNPAVMEPFELRGNEEMVVGRVAQLLPRGSFYYSSVSSTIKWARALGIPTLDFDVYSYDYTYYHNCEGITCVATPEEVKNYIESVNQNRQLPMRSTSEFWGKVDGKFSERLATQLNATVIH